MHETMENLAPSKFWAEIARNAWRIEINRRTANIEARVLKAYDLRPEGWFPGMRCAYQRREAGRRTWIDERTIAAIWSRKSHRDILDRHRPVEAERSDR